MANPWTAEFPLTGTLVDDILADQFPEIEGAVDLLGEGWDYFVFQKGSRAVFRFPKRQQCARALETEASFLAPIAGKVSVKVPMYRWRGIETKLFPLTFYGYERLSGVSIASIPLEDQLKNSLAEQAIDFFNSLHSIDLSEALKWGVPATHRFRKGLDHVKKVALERLAMCRNSLPDGMPNDIEKSIVRVQGSLNCLIHSDINSHHLLVESSNLRLVGVIDWTDACLGDPATDVGGLLYSLGKDSVLSALERYKVSLDREFFCRAIFYGVYIGLAIFCFAISEKKEDLMDESLKGLCTILE